MSLLSNKQFLIVEDETLLAMHLANILRDLGGQVVGMAGSESQALQLTETQQPDLVLMDINLGAGGNGIEAARSISHRHSIPVIFTTAYADDQTILNALDVAPFGYLVKPFGASEVKTTVTLALDRYRLEQMSHEPAYQVSDEEQTAELRGADSFLKQVNEGMVVMDRKGCILQVNEAICRMFETSEPQLLGKLLSDLLCQGRSGDNLATEMTGGLRIEVSLKAPGLRRYCLLSVTELQDSGTKAHFVALFSDITQLKETEKELSELAFRDHLTGVGNRNYMASLMDQLQESRQALAIIFIDLDAFKPINDAYGHEVGDQVLIECAERLSHTIRAKDHLIRLGGDEFVIVMSEPDDSIETFAERLLSCIERPIDLAENSFQVSASIGIAVSGEQFDVDDLLQQADIAMYHAKQGGRHSIAFFREDLRQNVEYRLFIEQGLRSALDNKQLTAYFQPIVNREGKVTAIESLARWHVDGVGLVPPERFIPVAEQTRLIHAIGMHMFREACIAARLLEDKGHGDIRIHVNVSTVQLRSPNLVADFQSYLAEHGLAAERFILEITESTLHTRSTRHQLLALKKAGFSLAVDDFGVGYSSLYELHQPVYDCIKIDKSLLPDLELETSGSKRKVIRHLVNLCQDLGIPTTIEGLETRQLFDFAHEIGGQSFQGFCFSRPLHLFALIDFLNKRGE